MAAGMQGAARPGTRLRNVLEGYLHGADFSPSPRIYQTNPTCKPRKQR